MNRKILFAVIAVGIIGITFYTFQETGQNSEEYVEKVKAERTDKNAMFKTSDESPLTKEQKEQFISLSYFPVNEKYKTKADFRKNEKEQIIEMAITDGSKRRYLVYGSAHVHLDGKELDVTVYKQPDEDSDYLFIPFYDLTSAELTYGGGRYVEPEMTNNGQMIIDFNMAYNPYCAYNHTYRCPIPPQENNLKASILAGEKIPDFVH